MTKYARNYTSDILDELLSEITPEEQRKTDKKMLLADKIYRAIKTKGWKKGDLAKAMGKQPSVISKWLSGTHNFESDTLLDLEEILNINLFSLEEPSTSLKVVYTASAQTTVMAENKSINTFNIPAKTCLIYTERDRLCC